MTNGRYSQGNRTLTRETLYGDNAGATTVLFYQLNGQGVSFVSWNPGFPSAVKATRVHVTSETAGITVAGAWTLSIYKNESLTASATFSFTPTVGSKAKDVGAWSNEVQFEEGDTYHIGAAGPEKNTLITRVTLEFEVL